LQGNARKWKEMQGLKALTAKQEQARAASLSTRTIGAAAEADE
jgi:hypothetical protein